MYALKSIMDHILFVQQDCPHMITQCWFAYNKWVFFVILTSNLFKASYYSKNISITNGMNLETTSDHGAHLQLGCQKGMFDE